MILLSTETDLLIDIKYELISIKDNIGYLRDDMKYYTSSITGSINEIKIVMISMILLGIIFFIAVLLMYYNHSKTIEAINGKLLAMFHVLEPEDEPKEKSEEDEEEDVASDKECIAGPTGPKGDKGDRGYSAYDLWLLAGHTGTLEDFFNYPKVDGNKPKDELDDIRETLAKVVELVDRQNECIKALKEELK